MNAVKLPIRSLLPYFLIAFLVAISSILFANQSAIAKQLDSWQLLPRPEGLTELYFADDKQLPEAVKGNSTQGLTFVVHNLEHEKTTYRYKLVAVEGGNGEELPLGAGMMILSHDQSQTVTETVKIPPVNSSRIALKVELEYMGIPFGKKTLNAQHQSIQYWANTVGRKA